MDKIFIFLNPRYGVEHHLCFVWHELPFLHHFNFLPNATSQSLVFCIYANLDTQITACIEFALER